MSGRLDTEPPYIDVSSLIDIHPVDKDPISLAQIQSAFELIARSTQEHNLRPFAIPKHRLGSIPPLPQPPASTLGPEGQE